MNLSATYFRTAGVRSPQDRENLHAYLTRRFSLLDSEFNAVIKYLVVREREVKGKDTFGFVYDITRYCNLECAHCCVAAVLKREAPTGIRWETTTAQVKLILDKLHRYVSARQLPHVFLIFGGGEPTMRPDFREVAEYANGLFRTEGLGVNTNGTFLRIDQLLELEPYFGFIEMSIDGFEAYHNRWRNPKSRAPVTNPFQATVALLSQALREPALREKIEVSTAVTTENLESIPDFVRFLDDLGVTQYSIHRAMPVGRMGARLDSIPTSADYIRLLLMVAQLRETTGLKRLHIHHSLESIYSGLFLGRDIHASPLLTGSGRHSIGIDPQGNVYFDPWGVIPPFSKLSAGNLLDPAVELADMVDGEGSLIRLADEIAKTQVRCRQCRMNCRGGMRFNALGQYIYRTAGGLRARVGEAELVAGLSEIDPACPLYEE